MLNRSSAIPGEARWVSARGADDLVIEQAPVSQWTQLCVFPGEGAAVSSAWQRCVGCALPESSTRFVADGASRIYRVAVDQYWLRDFTAQQIASLETALPAESAALIDLSDSRVTIRVAGRSARDILSQWVTVDLHPSVFPVGAFAQTGIHHVGGLIERNGPDDYAFVALRTFALTVWEALTDVAYPFV
jgi:methylglutamate dehydrogenase subunit D